jgi:hypothetical protein
MMFLELLHLAEVSLSKRPLLISLALICCLVNPFSSGATAQDFSKEISLFIGENARQFLQPIADGLFSNAHAGVFSATHGSGLSVELRFVAIGATMREDQKSFIAAPFSRAVEFNYNGTTFLGDLEINSTRLPTAVGLGTSATFTGRLKRVRPKGLPYVPGLYDFIAQDATITIGGQSDVDILPLVAPQLTVGSLFGTEFMISFLPHVSFGNVGKVKAFGFGIKHEIGNYVHVPFDLGVQFTYNSLKTTSMTSDVDFTADLSAFALQLQLDKMFAAGAFEVGPYCCLGIETGSLDARYQFVDPYLGTQTVHFDNGTRSRFTSGALGRIAWFALNAEYNFALVNGFAVGMGVMYEFR